jgi:hypothetical protein
MVGTYALVRFTLTYIGLAAMALRNWVDWDLTFLVIFILSIFILSITAVIISIMYWFGKSVLLKKLPEILQWLMLLNMFPDWRQRRLIWRSLLNIFSDWSPTQLGQWLLLVPFGLEVLLIMFVVPLQATSWSLLLTTEHL